MKSIQRTFVVKAAPSLLYQYFKDMLPNIQRDLSDIIPSASFTFKHDVPNHSIAIESKYLGTTNFEYYQFREIGETTEVVVEVKPSILLGKTGAKIAFITIYQILKGIEYGFKFGARKG